MHLRADLKREARKHPSVVETTAVYLDITAIHPINRCRVYFVVADLLDGYHAMSAMTANASAYIVYIDRACADSLIHELWHVALSAHPSDFCLTRSEESIVCYLTLHSGVILRWIDMQSERVQRAIISSL